MDVIRALPSQSLITTLVVVHCGLPNTWKLAAYEALPGSQSVAAFLPQVGSVGHW